MAPPERSAPAHIPYRWEIPMHTPNVIRFLFRWAPLVLVAFLAIPAAA